MVRVVENGSNNIIRVLTINEFGNWEGVGYKSCIVGFISNLCLV